MTARINALAKRMDDSEYPTYRYLDHVGHDFDRLTVDADSGDHGIITIALEMEDSTGSCAESVSIWPCDLPALIEALQIVQRWECGEPDDQQ